MNLICGINPVLEALAAGTRHFDGCSSPRGCAAAGSPRRSGARPSSGSRCGSRCARRSTGWPAAFPPGHHRRRLREAVLSLESLLDAAHSPALVVVLDGVEDPRNLGAILRTAEAAGADGVVCPSGTAPACRRRGPRLRRRPRARAVARVGNLVQALEALKARGVWSWAWTRPATSAGTRWTRPSGGPRARRRGARHPPPRARALRPPRVDPHFGHVASLNVSVAAGIALYEAVRPAAGGAEPRASDPGPSRFRAADRRSCARRHGDGSRGAAAAASGRVRHELDDHEPDGDEPLPVTHVDPHEDVAWGQGPTVLKSVGFNRLRRPNGRRARDAGGREAAGRLSATARPAPRPATAAPRPRRRAPKGTPRQGDARSAGRPGRRGWSGCPGKRRRGPERPPDESASVPGGQASDPAGAESEGAVAGAATEAGEPGT